MRFSPNPSDIASNLKFLSILTHLIISICNINATGVSTTKTNEKLLRHFVNYVHSVKPPCPDNNLTVFAPQHTSGFNLLESNFPTIFSSVITHTELNSQFANNIQSTLKIAINFHRWYHESERNLEAVQSYLTQLLRILKRIDFKPSHTTEANWTTIYNNFIKFDHLLLGIGFCFNQSIYGYAGTAHYTNSRPCNLFDNHKLKESHSVQILDSNYDMKFASFWLPTYCDRKASIPVIIRYVIYPITAEATQYG